MATRIINVIFRQTFPSKDIVVPLDQAWDFYLESQKEGGTSVLVKAAEIEMDEVDGGKRFTTFAKQWMVWDFAAKVWHIASIGLGAYGYGCGARNPNLAGRKCERRYEKGSGWISGLA